MKRIKQAELKMSAWKNPTLHFGEFLQYYNTNKFTYLHAKCYSH